MSFTIEEGETFGLVGESGSGKSTTGRCMLRLVEPTSGEVRFRGENVLSFSSDRMRAARRDMQIVFQDPYSSLNPRMRAGHDRRGAADHSQDRIQAERRERVAELFRLVGLDPAQLDRYPHEFSGGQRQRIGLARALALNPSFVIPDEPVSALDVSIQAQVINLLMDLQQQLKLTYLFIAHDLRLVEHICTRVAVMYLGRIVEMGATRRRLSPRRSIPTRARCSRRFRCPIRRRGGAHRARPRAGEREAPLREIAARTLCGGLTSLNSQRSTLKSLQVSTFKLSARFQTAIRELKSCWKLSVES